MTTDRDKAVSATIGQDRDKAVLATRGRGKGRVVSVTRGPISATGQAVTGGLAKVKPISEIRDLTSATGPAVVVAIGDRAATPSMRAMVARHVTFPSGGKPVSATVVLANLRARREAEVAEADIK